METILQDAKYPAPAGPSLPSPSWPGRRSRLASASPRRSSASSTRRCCAAPTRTGAARHRRRGRDRQDGKPSQFAPSMGDIRIWRTLTSISHAGGRVRFVPLIVDTGTDRLVVGEASGFSRPTASRPSGRTTRTTRATALRLSRCSATLLAALVRWRPTCSATSSHPERPVTIVGVLPAGFYQETAVWRTGS
jgi:hypothetical protein